MNYNIAAYHNGFGDNLQFSTIPERLIEQGHTVKLYVGPEILPFRNSEIKDFVWGFNPHIYTPGKEKPLCESAFGPWNAGDIVGSVYQNRHDDFIKNIEAMHGLMPENSLPKIYYKPNARLKTELCFGAIQGIIDLSAISAKYDPESVIAKVRDIIAGHPNITFKQLITPNQSNAIQLPEIANLEVNGLENISDIIHNCKLFISLHSGLHSLGAAIQRLGTFEQICLLPEKECARILPEKRFIFPGINYVKV